MIVARIGSGGSQVGSPGSQPQFVTTFVYLLSGSLGRSGLVRLGSTTLFLYVYFAYKLINYINSY